MGGTRISEGRYPACTWVVAQRRSETSIKHCPLLSHCIVSNVPPVRPGAGRDRRDQKEQPGMRGPRFLRRRRSECELIQSSALALSQRSTEDWRKEVKDGEGGERLIGEEASVGGVLSHASSESPRRRTVCRKKIV